MNWQNKSISINQDTSNSKHFNTHKTKESSAELLKKWKNFIEKSDSSAWNNWLENEIITKSSLNVGLSLAIQNYSVSTEMNEIIELLLNKGADPNILIRTIHQAPQNTKNEDKNAISLLMSVCLKADILWIYWLWKYKININYRDCNNKNALFYAILNKSDNVDVVDALVKNEIDVNCVGKVEVIRGNFIMHTPLSLAASYGLSKTFRYLLGNGGDVNYITLPNEDSILHILVRSANLEMIKLVLECKGARLDEKNRDGVTPQDLAASGSQTEIYRMINEAIIMYNKKKTPDSVNKNSLNNMQIMNRSPINEIQRRQNIINIDSNSQTTGADKGVHDNNNNNNNIIIKSNSNKRNSKKTFKEIQASFEAPGIEIDDIISKYKLINPYFTSKNHNFNHDVSLQIPISLKSKKHPKHQNTNPEDNRPLLSYIEISQTKDPTWTIDWTKKFVEYELINSVINKELSDKNDLIKTLRNEIVNLKSENDKLKINWQSLQDQNTELTRNAEYMASHHKTQYTLLQNEYEEKNKALELSYSELLLKYHEIEQKECGNSTQISPVQLNSPMAVSQYWNKKFEHFVYDKPYFLRCLSKDLIDYQQYVSEHINQQQEMIKNLIIQIQEATLESIQDFDVHLYGSHATGLCLPWSDLDVVLIPRAPHNISLQYKNSTYLWSLLYEAIRIKPWVKESKYISSATIPIIKIICNEHYNSMQIDISIQEDKHFGWKCVELVRNFIATYDAWKPLLLAWKNILKRANWNDPYKGGISSYGLILMIVYFLQIQKNSGKDITIWDSNWGRLFFEFVQYYGWDFNPENTTIYVMVNDDDSDDRYVPLNINGKSDWIITDPLNRDNNVSKSCYQFYNIKLSFIICIISLKEDCECACHYSGHGEQYNNLNLDHCFLKRIFNSVKRFQIS